MSPLPVDQVTQSSSASNIARTIINLLRTRDDEETYAKCHPQPNIDLCEKPEAASNTTTIVLSVLGGILVVGTIATLIVFHLRRQRSDAREWPKSQQELEDYGIGPMPSAPSNNGAPPRPKNAYRQPHVESDSTHLPPPGRRDSLKSLARSIRGNPDAYRSRPDDTRHDMKAVEPTSQL
ncbi:uncharacterized protein GGS22DRAFT_159298 [Annulohypoxylon maeteangense]|uniref:uncharacterized protein n=1 Tax=Annulohypoxylon maeteangense TaxID=1927788 RepID=UPI0020080EE1|nr:uncharacterized protein GGS22DRAFT_159298 [Annulohypoxylon maeteangense]KAI0887060.1 hypothetical protein GGS22DRAFT_159298 [Annulohypoxylon maeteangense]